MYGFAQGYLGNLGSFVLQVNFSFLALFLMAKDSELFFFPPCSYSVAFMDQLICCLGA